MKEKMRIELHNETEYTERISFQDIWTHASRLKYAGCRAAAITDRNSVDGIHMAEHDFMRRGIQPIYGVTLSCIDVDDRYDVVLLAANLTGRDNIFRLIELLERNRFSFGRAVTREQLDAHRKGILLGAAAKNGQIVRAILHRRDQRYLETITQDYDYLEFTSEPYDSIRGNALDRSKRVQLVLTGHKAQKFDRVVLCVTLLFDRKAVPQLDIFVNAAIAHRGIHELILERICAERLGLGLGSAKCVGSERNR